MKRKIDLKQQFYTRANLDSKTFNKENNSVDIIWTTGSKVLRSSFFDGPFYEELSMKPEHIRMDWLNSGKAPVLDNHNSHTSVKSILGVVESGEINGKKGLAKIRLSDREDVASIVNDVEKGIIKNISVGYRVYQYKEIKGKNDGDIPTYRATDWEPMEISLVTIPADTGAAVRSLDQSYECEIINNDKLGENNMSDDKRPAEKAEKVTEETRVTEPVEKKVPVDVDKIRAEAEEKARKEVSEKVRSEEIKRFNDIKEVCKKAGLNDSEAQRMFSENMSVEKAREEALNLLSEKSNKDETRGVHAEVGRDNARDARIKGATEALLFRSNPKFFKIESGEAQEFRYSTLLDLASDCLRGANFNPRHMSVGEIAERAFHSTSDFPLILENVLNKSLQQGYESLPRTFEPFIRMRPMRDFRTHKSLQKGPAPELLLKLEGSEIKSGTIAEGAEEYSLATYARDIQLTRETVINDDLNAFGQLALDLGQRIVDLENDLFWLLITTPQTMSDGNPLFHASHGNLGLTAGKPSLTTLSEGRQLGREQLDLDGVRKLNIQLDWLIVAPEDETVAQQITVQVQNQTLSPDQFGNMNPFTYLKPIVEPRIAEATQPFYMFGDASRYAMAEKGILQGQESGPQTSSYIDRKTKGLTTDIMYDVVFKIVNFRPFVKMPGA